jgi:hypothetical protein
MRSLLHAVILTALCQIASACTGDFEIPPIPRLVTATFSSDGSYLTAAFDSNVDASVIIGASSSFSCGILFSFEGASSSATCQFTSGTTAVAYLNGAAKVKVGNTFTVRGGTIQAKCLSDDRTCCESLEAVPEKSVSIMAPAQITLPVVVVPSNIAASVCAPPSIDLSQSYGSGGRAWEKVTLGVTTGSSTGPALKAFLNSSDFLTRAVSIDSNLLEAGFSYTLDIELCNFLGGCTSEQTVIDVQMDALPYVSVIGSASRSVYVYEQLKLEAFASLPLCGGSFVALSKLSFSWAVTTLAGAPVAATQTSTDKTKFALSAYALSSGVSYKVICTVLNVDTPSQVSSASVKVLVKSGNVVAKISGTTSRLLPFDSAISLDGSKSFDQDLSATANADLQFTFVCQQTAPALLGVGVCPQLQITQNKGIVYLSNLAAVYDAYAYSMTMTVVDKNNAARKATSAVSVSLLQSTAPLVEVSKTYTTSKINPQRSLTLNGAVTLKTAAAQSVTWSVDDQLLQAQLGAVSLTPVSESVAGVGLHAVALVLKANVLTRGTTYVFTLTCGTSKAAVVVIVNDPPRPGTFAVSPASGTEISTPFRFTTAFWTDEDAPVEFEFGFISNGVRLVLQPRSRLTSLTTSLPSGKDVDAYALQLYVRVFDSLNAVQESTFPVTVNPAASSEELLTDLSLVVSGAGTIGGLKQALSLVTSVINGKECSNAPDCAALSRAACGSVADTCGSCLDGYFGDAGDQNSLCISAASLSNVRANGTGAACSASAACLPWHTCDGEGKCAPMSKECISDCSGNGACTFVHTGTGYTLASCPLYDFKCAAQCVCSDGYFGAACDTGSAEITQRSGLRTQVLSGLSDISTSDNPSADAALSLIASLSAATDQAAEISSAAAETALLVANGILSGGQLGDLTTDQISGLLSSLDSVLLASAQSPDRRRLGVASFRREVAASLDEYGLLLGDEHLVAGQQSSTAEMSSFKTAAQKFGQGSAVAARIASSVGTANGETGTSVTLREEDSDGELLIVLSSISAALYTDVDDAMNSDGVRTLVRGANVSKTFTFTIQHNQEVEYPRDPSNYSFVTECDADSTEDFVFVCPDSGLSITHSCNTTASTLTSICPGKKTVSRCQNLEDAADVSACSVVSFTAASTVCECSVVPSGRRRTLTDSRGLLAEEDIGYLEVAAMIEVVGEDFTGTLYEAKNFNSLNDVVKVLTVIIMFGVMWVVGLGMTWYYAVRGATKDRKVELNDQLNLQRKIAAASTKTSVDKIKKYLDAYVNEVFPVVFRPSPWHERLITEIKKHHRYITIFTGGGDPRIRLMTTVHLLTIQSMLMFILAVFYDIQFPVDDGECAKLSQSACEDERSIFDHEKSKCTWSDGFSGDGTCDFVEPRISEQMIVLISIVVAICTAPINLVVDFIFDDILSAPTADSVKLAAEPNALQRASKQVAAARRTSVAAIKRASVSMQAAVAPRRRQSSKLMTTTTTRVIPESTISAQSLANASVTEALGIFKDSHQKYEDERSAILGTNTSKSFVSVSRRQRGKAAATATEVRPTIAVAAAMPGAGMFGSSVDARFAELSKEIIAQRRRLKPSEQEDFDLRWGFDPNGEFNTETGLSGLCCRRMGPEAIIKKELEFVAKETEEKYDKLKLATDAHTGLEMLHLFVLDLLGRDTPAAQIFSSKTSEDFRHAMIVSKSFKIFCWVTIVLLNLFFVFFAMLRGMERGSDWQMGYAVACVIQFIVEIFMFETIECIWVHYVIPDAASAEIYAAQHALKRTINSLCSTMSSNATYILDAPKYLFVSTNIADKFPDMLESMIIRSYHYHLPGEMERKWHVDARNRDSVVMRFLRNFSIFAITISVLQWVGSSPSSLQRAVIHTVNPLIFGGFFILILFFYHNPVYLTAVAGLVLYKVVQHLWRVYQKHRAENRPKKFERMVSNVVPVPSAERSGSAGSNRSARSINSISVAPLPTLDDESGGSADTMGLPEDVDGHVELPQRDAFEGEGSINESSSSSSDSDAEGGDAEKEEVALADTTSSEEAPAPVAL